jgi:cell division protein FtsQ
MSRTKSNQRKREPGLIPVLALVLLLSLSAGLSWAYHSLLAADTFRLQHVQINGIERLTREQVLDALGVPKGFNMLNLRMQQLDDRLSELAWVENAVVRLDLPARLTVSIRERKPLALLTGRPSCLVDTNGALFLKTDPDQYPDIPRLGGFADQALAPGATLPAPVPEALRQLLSELGKHRIRDVLKDLSDIEWSRDDGLSCKAMDGNLMIIFGTASFGVKCDRLQWVLKRLKANDQLEAVTRIDLDYGQKAFLTWRGAGRPDA